MSNGGFGIIQDRSRASDESDKPGHTVQTESQSGVCTRPDDGNDNVHRAVSNERDPLTCYICLHKAVNSVSLVYTDGDTGLEIYCLNCIKPWLNEYKTCPTTRRAVDKLYSHDVDGVIDLLQKTTINTEQEIPPDAHRTCEFPNRACLPNERSQDSSFLIYNPDEAIEAVSICGLNLAFIHHAIRDNYASRAIAVNPYAILYTREPTVEHYVAAIEARPELVVMMDDIPAEVINIVRANKRVAELLGEQ